MTGPIFLGPRLWNPDRERGWDDELDAMLEVDLDRESLDLAADQLPAPTTMVCPACDAEGCAACAGTGSVLASSDDEAALVAFRRAAAAFLHPSGQGDR
jgi:hypothetical protein